MRLLTPFLATPSLFFAAALSFASPVSAVGIDWVTVGSPNNSCDPQSFGCFGNVGSMYRIAKYEVTNSQYAEFLNAKAAVDPLRLWSSGMSITRSGTSGSFAYAPVAGSEDRAVTSVSFSHALRFVNWMHNGQGSGGTENGAYTLLGGSQTATNVSTVTRNAAALVFLPSENEWYKAAYYDPVSASYFDYPTGVDTATTCAAPGAMPNIANCALAVGHVSDVGSYTASPSPYGTFDQGGNAFEWTETIVGVQRGIRGGGYDATLGDPVFLAASVRTNFPPGSSWHSLGFRLASIPEPATGLLLMTGIAGLAGLRRLRA
jgi:formylglycine-generating enzyme required for sulfatase activity